MRLFVAIVPPPSALAELSAVVDELRAQADLLAAGDTTLEPSGTVQRLRWSSSDQWHLTLAFLGEVDEAVW